MQDLEVLIKIDIEMNVLYLVGWEMYDMAPNPLRLMFEQSSNVT